MNVCKLNVYLFWVFRGFECNFGTLILIRKWRDFACTSARGGSYTVHDDIRDSFMALFINVCKQIKHSKTLSQQEKLTPVSKQTSKFMYFLFLHGISIFTGFGAMSH